MKTIKSFRLISVSFVTISVMLVALACGGDDDDDGNGGTGGSTTPAAGSGGGTAGGGGASDTGGSSASGSGGSSATGGSGGSEMDAGQADGGQTLPQNVAEGGECTLTSILFNSLGTCSSTTDCPGGLPTQFDLSGIDATIAGLAPTPTSDQGNCAAGLTCCINTDQCAAVSASLAGNEMVQSVLATATGTLSIECVAPGSCVAASPENSFGEVPTGCPKGQVCCVNVPQMSLTTDAGTAAVDAGAGQ